MAKIYYRCVHQVDMAYFAPWGKGGNHSEGDREDTPLLVRHWIRVMPSRGYNARGKPFPPDYIVTEQPLARHFCEQTVKKVSRIAFDPMTGRRLPQRAYRKKVTKIKFELVDKDDLTRDIIEDAIKKQWAPEMFQDVPLKVELPIDPELEKMLKIMGPDEEPLEGEEMVPPEGQIVRKVGRPKKVTNAI